MQQHNPTMGARPARQLRTLGLLALALAVSAGLAQAQQRIPGAGLRRRVLVPQGAVRIPPNLRDSVAVIPPEWVEQLEELAPVEQERFLKNNQRFRSLPAEQQALIRRRLHAWNNLSDEQREAVLERQQIWQQLSSEQRRQVRESLLPRWQSLSIQRRQIILGKLRELRSLDGAQRNARLNDDAFLDSLSEEDQQMLRDLATLGAGQTTG